MVMTFPWEHGIQFIRAYAEVQDHFLQAINQARQTGEGTLEACRCKLRKSAELHQWFLSSRPVSESDQRLRQAISRDCLGLFGTVGSQYPQLEAYRDTLLGEMVGEAEAGARGAELQRLERAPATELGSARNSKLPSAEEPFRDEEERGVVPPGTMKEQPDAVRKKRGRPTRIPDELKRGALQAQGGKARAKILYRTPYPSPQQVKNVRSILRHFERTRQKPE